MGHLNNRRMHARIEALKKGETSLLEGGDTFQGDESGSFSARVVGLVRR